MSGPRTTREVLTGWGLTGISGLLIFGVLYLVLGVMNLFVDFSFVDRAAASLERLAAEHRGELIVLATHAGFIEASVLRFLVGSPAGSPHPRLRLRTAHASLTEWERSDQGWRLLRYNDAYAAPS